MNFYLFMWLLHYYMPIAIIYHNKILSTNFHCIPIKFPERLWELLELYWTALGQAEVWFVGRGLAVDPRLTPVVGQHLPVGQVDVHGEQVVVLTVVDVPLLPCHVTPPLPGVHV